MDPRANLRRQLELANEILGASGPPSDDDDAQELADLVITLDEWRTKGGFDPYADAVPSAPSGRTHIR